MSNGGYSYYPSFILLTGLEEFGITGLKMNERHYFYLNDGRVFATDGEDIFAYLTDKEFDGLRASYVNLNRRPIRNRIYSYKSISLLKRLRLKGTDLLMRAYRWFRRQVRLAKNKPIYFYYERTSDNT